MSLSLNSATQSLNGVGDKRSKNYEKLGILTVENLLYHFPRRYVDLTNPYEIFSAPFEQVVPVRAVLLSKSPEQRIRRGLSIFKLFAEDDSGEMEITIFNAYYIVDQLVVGKEYIFYGKLDGTFLKRTMTSPTMYPVDNTPGVVPIYPQTAGITSALIRSNITQALKDLPPLVDAIPEAFRIFYNIEEINASFQNIHFPSNMEAVDIARDRFVFEELLVLSCALHSLRQEQDRKKVQGMKAFSLAPFYKSLPYTPTKAQYRCISEALGDMMGTTPMNRLIQGDVGSGKTLVAAGAIFFAFKNKVQSALMVPTEILASQHHYNLKEMLSPFGLCVELLTGSTPAAKRREILKGLESGEIHLCVGTHALLSDTITFQNLGLVVTDEQHRFGVAQRATLSQKSENVHVLVMSATPIPRTLSLIIYGDLSLSILDEMPPGRQKIDTLLINSRILKRAMGFIREHIDSGHQAYIVCPLVTMGEVDTGLRPAVEYAEQLSKGELKGYRVGLLHGQMKSGEKEKAMRDFKNHETDVLVSTTVVEVGVDVPNATIIMVENAERFGLSQLHQLRGRVGRGSVKSYCILVSDAGGQPAKDRLQAMKDIDDGFLLAEKDLKQRGPGDFFGYRQHGLPTLKVADLAGDIKVLEKAQDCAGEILSLDPTLSAPNHEELRRKVDNMLLSVGERPN